MVLVPAPSAISRRHGRSPPARAATPYSTTPRQALPRPPFRRSLCSELFREPVGHRGSQLELLPAVANSLQHRAIRRIDSFLVELDRPTRVHKSIGLAVSNQDRAANP